MTSSDRDTIDPRVGGLVVIVLGLVFAGALTVGVMYP